MSGVLTCNNLHLTTNGYYTFRNFTMSFLEGSYILIYGSNGVGTTSLLKMMAGIMATSNGEVIKSRENESIFIGDDLDIKPRDSVGKNLARWAKSEDCIIDIVSNHFNLSDILTTKCANLSPGERKRVGFARLLINRPRLWFLDRPFEQLDDMAADALLLAIAGLCNNGGLVVCAAGVDRSISYYDAATKICLDDYT